MSRSFTTNSPRISMLSFVLCLAIVLSLLSGAVMRADEPAEKMAFVGTLQDLAAHELFTGAVAFSLNEPLALANSAISHIDPEDPTVVAWLDAQTNRAYAPLRYVGQSLGATVDWNDALGIATLTLGTRIVAFAADQASMEVNGVSTPIDAAPKLINGRFYLPLRALASAFEREVYFNDGLILLHKAVAMQKLWQEGDDLVRLLGLKLQLVASVGSYENLSLLLTSVRGNSGGFYYGDYVLYETMDFMESRMVLSAMPEADMSLAPPAQNKADGSERSADSTDEFSTTNVQVEGVDEADIVKTDGEYLYVVRGTHALIVRAKPANNMEVVAKIPYAGESIRPSELYIEQDRMVVIGSRNNAKHGNNQTCMMVYDISDRANPVLQRTVEVDGAYLSSRRIGSCYYLVSQKWFDYWRVLEKEADYRVHYADSVASPEGMVLPYDRMYCFPDSQQSNYLVVAAFDAAKNDPVDIQTYLGAGETVYVSQQSLFIALDDYRVRPTLYGSAAETLQYNGSMTTIFSFALDNGKVHYTTSGQVPGTVLNQFSLDEHQNHLRIATTSEPTWWGDEANQVSLNQLYVLDSQLNIVGSIENIAPGERIYSARFMGDRAFMVTFRTVDPLYVIDLKDPAAPAILGELKIPGYSDYLHPIGENHLLGFGKDAIAIPVKNSWGKILYENAYYLGMKLSLFDVTDLSNPVEKAMVIIGDRGTESSILRNHKALMYQASTGILAFPLNESKVLSGPLVSESGYPHYGDTVFDGLVIFHVDVDAGEQGLQELGRITQQQNALDKDGSLNVDYQRVIERGLYIGDTIYTLSPSVIQANSMKDFGYVGSIKPLD